MEFLSQFHRIRDLELSITCAFFPVAADIVDILANQAPTNQLSATVATVAASPPRRLRTLHVVNGEYYAGAERVQDLLARHLPEAGCDVGFACVKADQFPLKRQSRDVPLVRTPMRHPWSRRAVRDIARTMREEKYDIIHSHTPRSLWAAARVAKVVGCPLVHTMHDVFLGQPTHVARKVLNRYTISRLRDADFVTTVSNSTRQLAEELKLGKRRRMICNGVAAARPEFNRARPGDDPGRRCWNLGTVALIRPCKGIEVMVRAMARLQRRGCPARATVVGTFDTPQYQQEVLGLVERLGVTDLIDFSGFTTDVPARLEQFDLFLIPSVGPEGLPMVMLEAMAHSLPTVGSAVAGIADVIRPGVDGILFPPGDDKALADAVENFVAGKVDWLSMAQAARLRHAGEFSVQRMASEYAKVYREATDAQPESTCV